MAKMPASSSPPWKAFYGVAKLHVVVYRATGGKVGGKLADGKLLLLHHAGRKSGVERVTPIAHYEEHAGDRVIPVVILEAAGRG